MTEKQKQIFRLISKYAESKGCNPVEIDVDPYSFYPHNGRSIHCGSSLGFSTHKLPFDPSEIIAEFIESQNPDIDEENLYGLNFIMDTDKKIIKLVAIYQNIEDGASFSTQRDIETDENVKEIFPKLIEDGIYPYAEVYFSGGGDEGYIEDHMVVSSGDVSAKSLTDFPELEDLLYDMLNEYSGWENNEGGQGKFLIDTRAGLVELTLTYNEYVDEEVLIDTFKYD